MKVLSKEYWDNWLQKFFSFAVSVKFLSLLGSTALSVAIYVSAKSLLLADKINSAQYVQTTEIILKYWAMVWGVLIGARGAIQIADVIKKIKRNVK